MILNVKNGLKFKLLATDLKIEERKYLEEGSHAVAVNVMGTEQEVKHRGNVCGWKLRTCVEIVVKKHAVGLISVRKALQTYPKRSKIQRIQNNFQKRKKRTL